MRRKKGRTTDTAEDTVARLRDTNVLYERGVYAGCSASLHVGHCSSDRLTAVRSWHKAAKGSAPSKQTLRVRGICLLCVLAGVVGTFGEQYAGESLLPSYTGFIRVQGGRFVDADCQEFPVTGVNTWDLMESGAGVSSYLPKGIDITEYTMEQMAANGLTVVRGFGHGHNVSFPLEISPGRYNERAFQGLDHVLDSAGRNGVKVILTLSDNWPSNMSLHGTADSKQTYVLWGNSSNLDTFYTDPHIRQLYKDHVTAVVNRVNSINGLKYKDDPSIFAWDLMNEPRCNCFPGQSGAQKLPKSCQAECTEKITGWVKEMSSFMKKVDPNHMVTMGAEGFWGQRSPLGHEYNPGGSVGIYDGRVTWAAMTGQNFTDQHKFPAIDFCAAHYWPDMWTGGHNLEFFQAWMDSHAFECSKMGKPFVLEEFGKKSAGRDALPQRHQLFQDVYDVYLSSLSNGTYHNNVQGVLMWKWNLSPYTTRGKDDLDVTVDDATFTEIVSPAAMQALDLTSGNPVPRGCQPVKTATPSRAKPTQTAQHASQMASQAFEPPTAAPSQSGPSERAQGPPAESGPFQAVLQAAMKRDPREALQEAANAASKVAAVIKAPRGSTEQVAALGSAAGHALQGILGAVDAFRKEATTEG